MRQGGQGRKFNPATPPINLDALLGHSSQIAHKDDHCWDQTS